MVYVQLKKATTKGKKYTAVFYDEEFFNSFDLIENDIIKIKPYKHLLKRIEQDSIDSMVSSNRAGE